MSDDFSLTDALSGSSQAPTQKSDGQAWPGAQWGNQNPAAGQQNPGYQAGQPYWGYPGAPGGQQNPGYPGAPGGQQNPGYPGAPGGQQNPGYPGAPGGQQNPGYPGAPGGQQNPGYPGFPFAGQGGPGQPFPGFPSSGQQFPSAPTPGQPGPGTGAPGLPAPSGPVKVPYELSLPTGIGNRMIITIYGAIPQNPKRWNINLHKGSDIAFHFNPRYDESKKIIVRNSFICNQWGPEERDTPNFPIKAGETFKLQVLCEPNHYIVLINDANFCKYNHRVRELSDIRKLSIGGDITLTNVAFSLP